MVSIEPGTLVELLFDGDDWTNRSAGIQAIAYSVSDKHIVLSQTTPPLAKALFGKRLRLTYLDKSGDIPLRCGFEGRLRGLVDHERSPSERVPALVFERESDPETCNLRENFRIKPSTDAGLEILLKATRVVIVDISEGGACVRLINEVTLNPGDTVKLTIAVDGRSFDVESKVVRVWSPQTACGNNGRQQFASFRFLGNQAARENVLARKIFDLERSQIQNKIR
ncbi:MAG: PilZ domain-containing protein [Deltaproteobacteria bacterium]|nr:PilZ domain-containing protein [Deltaproteobacteria bacterium]